MMGCGRITLMRKKFKDASKGLRILWKYLSVYKRDLIFLSVLGVFSAIANGSVPFVMGKFLDAIISSYTVFVDTTFAMPLWALFLAIWGVAQLIAIGTDWTNDKMSSKISTKIFSDYLMGFQSALHIFPLSFHKNAKPGELSSAMNRAGNGLDSITGRVIIPLAPQFLSITIGIVNIMFNCAGRCIIYLFFCIFLKLTMKCVHSAVWVSFAPDVNHICFLHNFFE